MSRLCSSVALSLLPLACLGAPPPLTEGSDSSTGAGSTGSAADPTADSSGTTDTNDTTGSTTDTTSSDSSTGSTTDTTGSDSTTDGGSGFIELDGSPCVDVSAGEDLGQFIVEGTVESCSFDGGYGDGRMPEGLTLMSDCRVVGTIAEQDVQETTVDRVGTWAFIIRAVRQEDGVTAWVPHCASRDAGQMAYELDVEHRGTAERSFAPVVEAYTPGESLSFGTNTDPVFSVVNPTAECPLNSGPACDEKNVNVAATPSPLGDPVMTRFDETDHSYRYWMSMASAGPVDLSRPWAVTVDFDFCLESGSGECLAAGNVEYHGKGDLALGMIFTPDEG